MAHLAQRQGHRLAEEVVAGGGLGLHQPVSTVGKAVDQHLAVSAGGNGADLLAGQGGVVEELGRNHRIFHPGKHHLGHGLVGDLFGGGGTVDLEHGAGQSLVLVLGVHLHQLGTGGVDHGNVGLHVKVHAHGVLVVQVCLIGDLHAHFGVGVDLCVEVNTHHRIRILAGHGSGLGHTGLGQGHGKAVGGLALSQRIVVRDVQEIVCAFHQHRIHRSLYFLIVLVGTRERQASVLAQCTFRILLLQLHLHITQIVQTIVQRIGNDILLAADHIRRNGGGDQPRMGGVHVLRGLVIAKGNDVLFDLHIALHLILGVNIHGVLIAAAVGCGGRHHHIEGIHRRFNGLMLPLHDQIDAVGQSVAGQVDHRLAVFIGHGRIDVILVAVFVVAVIQHQLLVLIVGIGAHIVDVKLDAFQRRSLVGGVQLTEVDDPLLFHGGDLRMDRQLLVVFGNQGLGRISVALCIKDEGVRHGLQAVNGQRHLTEGRSGGDIADGQGLGVFAVCQFLGHIVGRVFQHGAQAQGIIGSHGHIHRGSHGNIVSTVGILAALRHRPLHKRAAGHGRHGRFHRFQCHQVVVSLFDVGADLRRIVHAGVTAGNLFVADVVVGCINVALAVRCIALPAALAVGHTVQEADHGKLFPVDRLPNCQLRGGNGLAHRQVRDTGSSAQRLVVVGIPEAVLHDGPQLTGRRSAVVGVLQIHAGIRIAARRTHIAVQTVGVNHRTVFAVDQREGHDGRAGGAFQRSVVHQAGLVRGKIAPPADLLSFIRHAAALHVIHHVNELRLIDVIRVRLGGCCGHYRGQSAQQHQQQGQQLFAFFHQIALLSECSKDESGILLHLYTVLSSFYSVMRNTCVTFHLNAPISQIFSTF